MGRALRGRASRSQTDGRKEEGRGTSRQAGGAGGIHGEWCRDSEPQAEGLDFVGAWGMGTYRRGGAPGRSNTVAVESASHPLRLAGSLSESSGHTITVTGSLRLSLGHPSLHSQVAPTTHSLSGCHASATVLRVRSGLD
eukprot:259267-Rhodomonas_salina.1